MTKSKHIYGYPLYYEIGFCRRNIKREIDFIRKFYKKHQPSSILESILDNGCGTGRHLEEFAILGIQVCGYDLSPEMVKYSSARLTQITTYSHVFRSDLRNFRTKRKYDMAICMNGSFQYLMTVKDVVDHLKCVANALKDNGLYLISLPAPEDFFLNPPGSIKSQWVETEIKGNKRDGSIFDFDKKEIKKA